MELVLLLVALAVLALVIWGVVVLVKHVISAGVASGIEKSNRKQSEGQ